jgi:hypothetical protein
LDVHLDPGRHGLRLVPELGEHHLLRLEGSQ